MIWKSQVALGMATHTEGDGVVEEGGVRVWDALGVQY